MEPWIVQASNGIRLPQIGWHLDARFPVARCFVSHAHFDHMAPHKLVLGSKNTLRLMQARMPGEREEIALAFGEPHRLDDGTRVTLHAAGHVFGSAMLRAENALGSLLYTGDFKLRPGLSAERCETPRADTLIMETTFGRPHYVFPPTEDVMASIVRFCRAAIEDGEVPVIFGYSLGKSQELLSGLAGAGLPVMLHTQTWKNTRVYEALGVQFPPYHRFSLEDVRGHVVMCPPQSNNSAWLRRISPRRTAAVTGWAMDPGAVFRYQCDAIFPLSDHAGYDDLLRFVEAVQPKRVYTVHGFTKDFARVLRARGIEAWALGEENQLELPIATAQEEMPTGGAATVAFAAVEPSRGASAVEETALADRTDAFGRFAAVAESVRKAHGKLEKTSLLADYFASLPDDVFGTAALYFTGRPFPQASGRALQLGWAVIKRALLAVAGINESDYRAAYQRLGDSGETAEGILAGRTRPEAWTLPEVEVFLDRLGLARGPVDKLALLEERLRRIAPVEAKYLLKIVTGDLRIGLKEGLVEDAIARATEHTLDEVREAAVRCGDVTVVARAARARALGAVTLRVFHPLQFMLASPEPDAQSIVDRLGAPVWLEEKYDGIRCQIHKRGSEVVLFSRDLRNITTQFPELADAARACPADFIGDGELLAWRDGRALPFSELQRRLGRRGDDFFLGAEVPVSLWLYDLLWVDGHELLQSTLAERRAHLERLVLPDVFAVAPRSEATTAEEIDATFDRARARGNEGLMAKDPASRYLPGRRGLGWLKLKKAAATLDVVVTGVEYGHGKRRGVLSDYTFSVRDESTGSLRVVGKAYSGLTDAEIAALTERFLETTLEVRGRLRLVEPKVVLEIAFDSIQPSDRHDSGYALRFPRIARIREDKTPAEIDTLQTCRRMVEALRATHG
ncbi:hypothetical protein ASA1KI_25330 [Opitutales bacterium ASA1]|uniref:ATP-dependent DNA ligase n=1 Tax=Congregicoccus parvus TaxID=3081749 RepID=UPI002B2D3F93|nr:hypothetical protein ASA1KI_25330 [Opitutales bacterium ASA1]